MTLEKQPPSKNKVRYGFQIGNLNFVYGLKISCELLRNSSIYSLPNTPKWMLGLINLRGNLVPVFDLEEYFDFETLADQHQLLLVLGKAEKAVAFRVKHYPQLLDNLIQEAIIPKVMPKIENFIIAAFSDQKIWLELDKEKFFSRLGELVCQ
jgi:twitching motility protein PilI